MADKEFECVKCGAKSRFDLRAVADMHRCKECGAETTWKRVTEKDKDAEVNNPSHYKSENGIEAIDAIEAALGFDGALAFCRGNALKYLWRGGKKNDTVQDLKKAAWFIAHEIKMLTRSQAPERPQ